MARSASLRWRLGSTILFAAILALSGCSSPEEEDAAVAPPEPIENAAPVALANPPAPDPVAAEPADPPADIPPVAQEAVPAEDTPVPPEPPADEAAPDPLADADPEPDVVAPPAAIEGDPLDNGVEIALSDLLPPLVDDIDADTDLLAALAAGDRDAGQSYAQRCTGCHSFHKEGQGPGGPQLGPILYGVLGRVIGSSDGFEYTPVFQAMAEVGPEWTAVRLDASSNSHVGRSSAAGSRGRWADDGL